MTNTLADHVVLVSFDTLVCFVMVILMYLFQLCSKTDDIEQLLMKTLFYVQASKEDDFVMKSRIALEIEKLTDAGLIQLSQKTEDGISSQYLEATRLGKATFKG